MRQLSYTFKRRYFLLILIYSILSQFLVTIYSDTFLLQLRKFSRSFPRILKFLVQYTNTISGFIN